MADEELERAMIAIGEKLEANGAAPGAVAEFTTMLRVHAEECAVLEDERDAALLDLDKALAAIERVRAALVDRRHSVRGSTYIRMADLEAALDPVATP